MTDPTIITMKTVQVSANLLFAKMIDNITVWILLSGFALLAIFSYWYFRMRKR